MFSRDRSTRVAVALLASGAMSFFLGSLLGSPSMAAPSGLLEMDGNVRSDGGVHGLHRL